MRKAIVFHDTSWGGAAHVPLVDSVQRHGYLPIVKDYKADQSYLKMLREQGVVCQNWDDFIDDTFRVYAANESKRRVEQILAQLNDPALLQGFASSLGHFLTVNAEAFFNSLFGRVRDQICNIEALKRIAAQYEVSLIVMGFDFLDHARGMLAFAQKEGIPTLGLTHAHVNNDQSALYAAMGLHPELDAGIMKAQSLSHVSAKYADNLAVDGHVSAENIGFWTGDRDKVFVTGSIRADTFYKKIAPDAVAQRKSRLALGLDPDRPVVLGCFSFSHGKEAFYANMSRYVEAYNRAVYEAVNAVPGAQLIIRPHPTEMQHAHLEATYQQQIDQRFVDWLAEKGYKDFHLIRDHKEDAIHAADVVISDVQSSVISEMMIMGKPVICTSYLDPENTLLGAEGCLLVVRELDQLGEVLMPLLQYPVLQEALVQRQSSAISRINYNHDGKAADRTAQLILGLANDPSITASQWEEALEKAHGASGVAHAGLSKLNIQDNEANYFIQEPA